MRPAPRSMARLHRSKRGQRCVPRSHMAWKTTTFTAGPPAWRTAPRLDGPMNGVAFLAYVERPRSHPGTGDRSSWTTAWLTRSPASNRQSRRRARHVCACRAYSPDFASKERFAKLKALLRKAAARTVDDLNRPARLYGMPRRIGILHSPRRKTLIFNPSHPVGLDARNEASPRYAGNGPKEIALRASPFFGDGPAWKRPGHFWARLRAFGHRSEGCRASRPRQGCGRAAVRAVTRPTMRRD